MKNAFYFTLKALFILYLFFHSHYLGISNKIFQQQNEFCIARRIQAQTGKINTEYSYMRRKALFTYTSYCKCTSFIRIFIRQREPRKLTCRIYESHFLQIFKNVLLTQLLFLYHSGMILQQKQPQQLIITTTGQMPQQQPQQPYEMNKVDFTQQSQPMMSQQPVVNQGSIVCTHRKLLLHREHLSISK